MKKSVTYQNGNTLSYAEYGNPAGYPILIQHGLIASINEKHLFDRLIAGGARLICIARPGYGQSSPYPMQHIADWADIVAVLIAWLGLEQFDVLGISSGAPYSYAIGHRFPERVRNLFILSGIPALYDETIQAHWPHPVQKNASMSGLQTLAYDLFFAHLSKAELEEERVRDSMQNHCFGIAQDLRIRCLDWGFTLSALKSRVSMRHSRYDNAVPLITAEMTARLLPDCQLAVCENDVHFSQAGLDDFITTVINVHQKE